MGEWFIGTTARDLKKNYHREPIPPSPAKNHGARGRSLKPKGSGSGFLAVCSRTSFCSVGCQGSVDVF